MRQLILFYLMNFDNVHAVCTDFDIFPIVFKSLISLSARIDAVLYVYTRVRKFQANHSYPSPEPQHLFINLRISKSLISGTFVWMGVKWVEYDTIRIHLWFQVPQLLEFWILFLDICLELGTMQCLYFFVHNNNNNFF
jgi:hypothetical protein